MTSSFTAAPRPQAPPAGAYHPCKEVEAQAIPWFLRSEVASISGLFGMLAIGGAVTDARSRRKPRRVLVRLGFLLAHLFPWIPTVLGLVTQR